MGTCSQDKVTYVKEHIAELYAEAVEKHGEEKIDDALEYILILMVESRVREHDV